jgi:hypothetical protein
MVARLAEFLANARDVDVEVAMIALQGFLEGTLGEVSTTHGDTRAASQTLENVELDRSQIDGVALDFDRSTRQIQLDGSDRSAISRLHRRTSKSRLDASEEFLRPEGFGQIVVSPEFEAPHLVVCLLSRRQDQNGDVRFPAKLLEDVEAVFARQHEIEDDEIVVLRIFTTCLVALLDPGDLETLVEQGLEDVVSELEVVFDEK